MIWYPVIGLVMAIIVIVLMLLKEAAEKVDEMPVIVGTAVLSFLFWPVFLLFIFTWWLVLILKSIVAKEKK